MMKRLIQVTLVINSIFCFAQVERSGKFKINASYEYRVVPFFYDNIEGFYISSNAYNYSKTSHLDGGSINFDFEYFFVKNTSFVLTQSMRFDELYSDLPVGNLEGTFQERKSRFIFDTHLQMKHYIPLKNSNHSIIGLIGYSIMNYNTAFKVLENSGLDENGNIIYTRTSPIDWKFGAYKVGIGYQYKRSEILAGSYFVSKHNFDGTTDIGFGLPFIKINYNFLNF